MIIGRSVEYVGSYAFSGCSSLQMFMFSKSTWGIYDHAFTGCNKLTFLIIPDSVTAIHDYAFSECTNLTHVAYAGLTDPKRGDGIFNGCNKLIKICVPKEYSPNSFCGMNNVTRSSVCVDNEYSVLSSSLSHLVTPSVILMAFFALLFAFLS